ncbi:MAG: hypothetical protein M0R41_06915 [Methylobacter tundripaludum]|nr:hypothetical protein [Methylobacter tundripaludum]
MTEENTNPIGKLPKWQQYAIFFILFFLGMAVIDTVKSRFGQHETPIATSPAAVVPPIVKRSTFNMSVEQLIGAYNALASKVADMKTLPPKESMDDGGSNENSRTLQYYVLPNAVVDISIDKKTGKPYSLGVYSTSSGAPDEMSLFAVRSIVGATVFGPSSEAGELEKLCIDIYATGQTGALSKRIKDMTIFCGNNDGIWIAGISTPKE